MQTRLDITCDPSKWADLPFDKKLELQLQAEEDPVFFWEDPRMGGMPEENGYRLWPMQQKILREFFKRDKEGRRKYKELLLAAGMRSGKTAIAALIILSELSRCLMLESPQQRYNLLPKEEIYFIATASTEEQCIRTIFKKVIAMIENSPYLCSFADKINFREGRIEFPKRLVVLALGSNLRANVGLTVKVFVAEEINFTGEESYKISPRVLYNRLSKSTTTFKPFGEDIKVAISSQANGHDFLSKRMELTIEQKLETTLIMKKHSLEMNPHIKEEDLRDEELMDEESYSNDYGFGTKRTGSSYFKEITVDRFKEWKLPNIFRGEPQAGSNKAFTPDLLIRNLKFDKNAVEYGLGSDPSSVGDGFGLSLGHLTINGEIIIDGMTVFKCKRGDEIDPAVISMMVNKIIQTVPVSFYAYDIYMYNELRTEIDNLGIETFQHQLRLPDWEAYKERVDLKRLTGPHSQYFIEEASDLQLVRNKVDHTTGGSKDMIDSTCQLVAYWDQIDKQQSKGQSIVLMQGMR